MAKKVFKSDESLVELVADLFKDISNFISDKKIDEEKVQKYDRVLELLEKRRDFWALNRNLSPIDSIKIYGAYSTVFGTLYGVAYHLNIGIKKRENPKAAKEVYSILNDSAELISKLEATHFEKHVPAQLISDIFDSSRALRRQAINKQLIQAGETPNRVELIKELRSELELQLE